MRSKEILRLVDSLHRNKDIDTEIIFRAIENALQSAAEKRFDSEDVSVQIDRETGEVQARIGEQQVDPQDLGRIAAQTAKQIITQRIREAESEMIYQEFAELKGSLVTGMVQRFEGGSIIVNLDKAEGILPRSEQIPGEHYQPGERLRALVLDVRKAAAKVKIILSRTHPDFVERLFEIEVPEVAEGVVVARRIAREPGQRTKIAMESLEPHVDCIGACVGVRGTRIKSIIDELNGEKIDIIPWREAPEMLIADSLKPAEILQMTLEESDETKRATVIVPEDQLALAIGRKGQNVRLAVKLSGWDIDIQPPSVLEEEEEAEEPEVEQEEELAVAGEEGVPPEEAAGAEGQEAEPEVEEPAVAEEEAGPSGGGEEEEPEPEEEPAESEEAPPGETEEQPAAEQSDVAPEPHGPETEQKVVPEEETSEKE